MRATLLKRLSALEAKMKPAGTSAGLGREIKEMTPRERNCLREYILHLKSGGQSDDGRCEILKGAAEDAINAARLRLRDAA
ncbi:MAG: hypothetical protein EB015_11155 [Methylocystaceae bacterium]|nr:hypothetical protein [Methylocystaceae bacterium]